MHMVPARRPDSHAPNRLIHATSPYLLQHAHNPVDWYEWGPEAFERARQENKPIHLSVGYHACHWCHVMAHESFENEATAELLNANFVNIKVDREQRPDIDGIYMTAVQAMTGSGGWPMTVFLTPDGMPFYGGTYFPPEERYGMPSFRRVLVSIADAFRERRADLEQAGAELLTRMRAATTERLGNELLSADVLDEAYAVLHGMFEPTHGGFGGAPKFPQPMVLEFLLRYAVRTNHRLAGEMFEKTMHAMAEGGLFDQLGGGFHRYSVDSQWLVPHFEKMLYDNALLARTYVEAYQATGESFYRGIAEATLDYLLREMRHPGGGFYSTQDADSFETPESDHAEEGAFFVWTPAQLRSLLGSDAMAFAELFDVTEHGNFEGKNILHVKRRPAEVARVLGVAETEIHALIERSKTTLLAARARRPAPATDDKILTAWNGMAIRAFAAAARAFGRDDYREAAQACAHFVLTSLRTDDGMLLRDWRAGQAGTTLGFLEDYALLADGLLVLYEATFDERWLVEARNLADAMLTHFWDDQIDGFYDTSAQHEQLVVRPRDTSDNATPCGNSVAADLLLRLALLCGEQRYRDHAEQVLSGMAPLMARYPTGFGRYLSALEFALAQPHEIALVGEPGTPELEALVKVLFTRFRPNQVVALRHPGAEPVFATPLLEGRELVNGQAAAYVCQNYTCRLPVTIPAALEQELA